MEKENIQKFGENYEGKSEENKWVSWHLYAGRLEGNGFVVGPLGLSLDIREPFTKITARC